MLAAESYDPSVPEKVLVVDDEHDNAELVERVLRGYDVISFTDPLEALKEVTQLAPDSLVVDYRMPKLNGLEFLKRCRERDVRCVALMVTAFPELDDGR